MNANFFRRLPQFVRSISHSHSITRVSSVPVQAKRLQQASIVAMAVVLLPVFAAEASPHPRLIAATDSSEPIRPKTACPDQLEALMSLMLRDLPSYANRVSQRAYTNYRTAEVPGYVLLAGRPEYEPLTLAAGEYTSTTESKVPQVFFTTLERQYFSQDAFRLQHYHWLFLTQTESGWRFVLMLSAVGDVAADEPPTPPRDSSQGVIAQAIRLWLRDCAAGSIAP
jgi:hypothetical protein